jgi:hypothetical protein
VPDEFALNRCPAVLIRSEEVERFQRTDKKDFLQDAVRFR